MLRRILVVVSLLVLAGIVVELIRRGYSVPWTGFGASPGADGKVIPAKTLWDWLDLLLVPLFLAIAVWLLDGSRKASELRVEADRQRQKTLDDYFECMTKMLVELGFSDDASGPSRAIARTRTLAALRSLDGGRKAQLLQFLYESGLVGRNPIVQLNGADFRNATLDEAVLRWAELRGVHFQGASFRNATLDDADLQGSDFSGADLSGATLDSADLTQANLSTAFVARDALEGATTDQAFLPWRS